MRDRLSHEIFFFEWTLQVPVIITRGTLEQPIELRFNQPNYRRRQARDDLTSNRRAINYEPGATRIY